MSTTIKMPWFRMYVDFLNDPKMIALAFEDQRHFIGLLALKSDGALDGDIAPDLLDRIVAQRLWIDHAVIREVKKRLMAAGLINEGWHPLAWEKRQMRSDTDATAAERKRRQRDRERAKAAAAEAANNAAAGCASREVTDVSRVTVTDVPGVTVTGVTRTDIDIDRDAEEEPTTAVVVEIVGDPAAPAPPQKPKRASPTGTRLPDGWRLPKAWGDWALDERPDWTDKDVRHEADCFADYWRAKAGKDGRKADWLATWRNWVRRSGGLGGAAARSAPRGPSPDTPTETYAQRAARQRMEEVAPMAARKAPGAGFEAAQRFMAGGTVIDVAPRDAAPRLATGGAA